MSLGFSRGFTFSFSFQKCHIRDVHVLAYLYVPQFCLHLDQVDSGFKAPN